MSTSKSGRRDSHGQYRGVQAICAALGFDSNDKTKARSYPALRDKVIQYRKDFVQEQAALLQDPEYKFPTSFQVKDAQDCAIKFVKEHRNLFLATREGLDAGWLTLPDDAEEIQIDITKMMCIQAKKFYEKPRKSNYIERSESIDSLASTLSTNYGSRKVERQVSESIYHADPVDILASYDAMEEDSDLGDLESQLQSQGQSQLDPERRSIEDFLESAYPSNDVVIGTESRWVFEPKSYWPDNLKAFSYRWILDKQAFVLRKRSANLREFVKALRKQIRLTDHLEEEQEEWLSAKAQKFLSAWITKWKSETHRVLQEVDDHISLHPIAHSAWVKRKWQWKMDESIKERALYQVPNNDKRPLDEPTPDQQPVSSWNYANKKPRHQHTHSHDADEMARAPTSASFPPRISASIFRRSFSEMQQTFGGNSIHTPPSADGLSSRDPIPGAPTMRASPTHPVAASPSRTIVADQDAPQRSFNPEKQRAIDSTTDPQPEQGRGSARSDSPRFQRPTAPWQSKVSPEPDLPRITLQAPQSPARPHTYQMQQHTHSPRPSEQSITLLLVAEKGPGSLNSANPISLQDFQTDTVETFLARVLSRRHSQPIAQVWSQLKFTQVWGDREVFVVSKGADGEMMWQEVRSNIEDNFEYARETMPELKVFKVWIRCEFEEGKNCY